MSRTAMNDRKNAVTKFCLGMEEHRRTDAGRVRTAREMVDFFFPRGPEGAEDRLFFHIPQAVRGPIVAGWGIRGPKSAERDSDEKIRQVVFDALAAGDIDEAAFEEGVDAQILIDWIPLTEWWSFWRSGKLTGVAIQKALATGRELGLFDDRWFLENVDGRGGKLKGTDTLCDTLSKDQIIAWVRGLHKSGDGSPAGLVAALGWETILAKTSQEALLFALDAFAKKVGLVAPPPEVEEPKPESAESAESAESPESPESPGVAMPEIPADLEPPSMSDQSMWTTGGTTSEELAEARAQMLSQLAEEQAQAASWPAGDATAATAVSPVESGTMRTAQENQAYGGTDDEATGTHPDKPRGGPPPVPRKRAT